MTQINLLPWREQRRQANKNRYLAIMGFCIGLSLFIILLMHVYWSIIIGYQVSSNTYLQNQLVQEQMKLGLLIKKKKEQAVIESDLKFILGLRNSSYNAVRLLDTLIRVVPDSVTLLEMKRSGNDVTIIGKAQSNLQVTSFMENITKASIFKQPELTVISTKENITGEEQIFQIQIKLME